MSDHDTLETMPEQSLEDEIATLSATLSAATHRLITLVGEFDRREAWADPLAPTPCRSCAHWLSYRAGISLGTARQYVKLAKSPGPRGRRARGILAGRRFPVLLAQRNRGGRRTSAAEDRGLG